MTPVVQNDHLVERVRALLQDSIDIKTRVARDQCEVVVAMAQAIADAFARGGKLLLCGNGGSAADAQHIAAEFLVRLRPDRDRPPLPALALHTDTSALTASSNDLGYEGVFARMVEALGVPGDVLIALSTSGRSLNVVRALEAARSKSMTTLGFLGSDGGAALKLCHTALLVPSTDPGRVQETHIAVGHAMVDLVETILFSPPRANG